MTRPRTAFWTLISTMLFGCAPSPARLRAALHPHEPRELTLALRDLGHHLGQAVGATGGFEVTPRSLDEVQRVVRAARALGVSLRVRGRGHSKHGGSLPQAGEVLLRTHGLRGLKFVGDRAVTVGAGVVLERLRALARARGLELPVFAAGGVGPSVGGFVAAGGVGRGSARFGGFWDNVDEVALVDGQGQLRRLRPADPHFRWVFGSMGQLGVVVEVTLRLVPSASVPADPIEVTTDAAERRQETHEAGPRPGPFWFTLFTPDAHVAAATRDVEALLSAHTATVSPLPTILYPIRRVGPVPPCVYPRDEAFTGVFFWGELRTPGRVADALAIERAFHQLVHRTPAYRRYVQSEIVPPNFDWRAYLGTALYERFRAIKRAFDPDHLFNRGSVFR